jgi:hypothetical protein
MLRSIALYVILVGVPLTGLFALLDWGQSLVPPPAIGGRWALAEPASTCPGLSPTAVISIEQSGRFLRVRVDDLPFGQGRLDDGLVSARIPVAMAGCTAIAIEAALDPTGRLVGHIGTEGCGSCPGSALVAHRLDGKE